MSNDEILRFKNQINNLNQELRLTKKFEKVEKI